MKTTVTKKTAPKEVRRPAYCPHYGGNPALNLVNTYRKDTKGRPVDELADYGELLYWCMDKFLIDYELWYALEIEQRCYVEEAEAAFGEAMGLRTVLSSIFNSLAAAEAPDKVILQMFDLALKKASKHLEYQQFEGKVGQFWVGIDEELQAPVWMLTVAAARLMESAEVQKLCKCPICGALFVDESRSRTRKWCNPNSCGALKKSVAYYARKNSVKSSAENAKMAL
ncbi:MAG TPA: CGNR zinc finger domain-containing protein [Mucilaginibacter sp.]|nr:CGNR zinc finger domain-containing protein [Mucilaginibacter sp.]